MDVDGRDLLDVAARGPGAYLSGMSAGRVAAAGTGLPLDSTVTTGLVISVIDRLDVVATVSPGRSV